VVYQHLHKIKKAWRTNRLDVPHRETYILRAVPPLYRNLCGYAAHIYITFLSLPSGFPHRDNVSWLVLASFRTDNRHGRYSGSFPICTAFPWYHIVDSQWRFFWQTVI